MTDERAHVPPPTLKFARTGPGFGSPPNELRRWAGTTATLSYQPVDELADDHLGQGDQFVAPELVPPRTTAVHAAPVV
ncbi:MAG: hypothetical protein K2V38_28435 [Gemmataceae bacterium]|nr:hypothetical protein [Gemmataceae bacterium]